MFVEITYKAFFRCEFPVQVERKGTTWTIDQYICGNSGHIFAKRPGDCQTYDVVRGGSMVVEQAKERGFEVPPKTVRFELMQALAARGQAEIQEIREEVNLRDRLKVLNLIAEMQRKAARGQWY